MVPFLFHTNFNFLNNEKDLKESKFFFSGKNLFSSKFLRNKKGHKPTKKRKTATEKIGFYLYFLLLCNCTARQIRLVWKFLSWKCSPMARSKDWFTVQDLSQMVINRQTKWLFWKENTLEMINKSNQQHQKQQQQQNSSNEFLMSGALEEPEQLPQQLQQQGQGSRSSKVKPLPSFQK